MTLRPLVFVAATAGALVCADAGLASLSGVNGPATATTPTGNRSATVGISVTFGLTVPANACTGSYATTITLAASTGP